LISVWLLRQAVFIECKNPI